MTDIERYTVDPNAPNDGDYIALRTLWVYRAAEGRWRDTGLVADHQGADMGAVDDAAVERVARASWKHWRQVHESDMEFRERLVRQIANALRGG
jgi:hypothetical protein